MIPQTRKYHAITVHFGPEATTKTLVAQLLSGSKIPDQIIVVDHAKKPLTMPPKPNLKIIRPEKNFGYGAGINMGLGFIASQRVNPDDIIIALNNDVTISPDSLARIQDWWQIHPRASLAGIQMGYVNLLTGRAIISEKSYQLPTTSYQLPYLDGAFLAAPLKVFLALQGFPTSGFMYWEDVTLSERARQMGIPREVITGGNITHTTSKPEGMTDDHTYYLVRNGAVFLSQLSPKPWRYLWKLKNVLRRLYHTVESKSSVVREALADAAHGKTGPRT